VVEAGQAGERSAAVLDEAMRVARAAGWRVVRGWAAPMQRDRIVCRGWIRTSDGARRALLAAVSGAGLIVGISADRETVDRFLDDLRRLGPVEHIPVATESIRLEADQRALLELLAEGLTLREAAAELGMPRRSADRRLAAARRVLGVDSTAGAVVAAISIRT